MFFDNKKNRNTFFEFMFAPTGPALPASIRSATDPMKLLAVVIPKTNFMLNIQTKNIMHIQTASCKF